MLIFGAKYGAAALALSRLHSRSGTEYVSPVTFPFVGSMVTSRCGSPLAMLSSISCGSRPVASALLRASSAILLMLPFGLPAPGRTPPMFVDILDFLNMYRRAY